MRPGADFPARRRIGGGWGVATDSGPPVWALALLLLMATGPLYPTLLRGWSEWNTDFSQVNAARKLVWAGIYAAMTLLLWRWRGAARAALAPHAALPLAAIWFAASCLWSPSPLDAALGLAQFALILVFGGALAQRLGPLGVLRIVGRAGLVALAMSLVMALVAPRFAFGQYVNAGAFRGVYIEKNHLATLLSYSFVAMLFETLTAPPTGRRRLLLGTGALLLGLIAARSSVALFQVALGAGFAGMFTGLRGARYGAAAAGFAALAGLAALGATLPATLDALGEDATLNGRTELWALLWPHVEARPIAGHGFFGFWSRPEAAQVREALGWNARGAHNGWLTALLTGGVVGAGLWALHWAGIVKAGWAALRPGGDPALAGCAALAAAHLVWSLFESNQLTQMNYHGIMAGMALAIPGWVAMRRAPGLRGGVAPV